MITQRTEYWLLDVVEQWLPLSLLSRSDVDIVFNQDSHGVEPTTLAAMLFELFECGYIIASHQRDTLSEKLFVPTYQEIEAGLAGRQTILYGLTVQGGQQWEQIAHPQWDRYRDITYSVQPLGFIKASTRALIDEVIALEPYPGEGHFVQETATWEELAPWQATYWKTLPHGVCAHIQYAWADAPLPRAEAPDRMQQQFHELTHWYVNPAA